MTPKLFAIGLVSLVDDLMGASKKLFWSLTDIEKALNDFKKNYTDELMSSLDLSDGQTFSTVSLGPYKLLKAFAGGEIIMCVCFL